MHDLLQEMGWEIVRKKHDCGQWSRLWLSEDISHMLTENRGTQKVKGIMLDKSEHPITHLNGRSFASMVNLRLLKIRNVDLSEDIEYLSNDLRFLKWPEYPSNSLPSNFQPRKLFELNLCRSRIKYLWKETKDFQNLKTIKLNYSHNLSETPDFTKVPNLEMLDLEGCTRLCKVHESVGGLKRLTILNLKGCKNLVSFPSNVSGLKLLKILNLQGCSKLEKLPQNLGELECLEDLDLGGTAIRQVPSSVARVTILNLKGCKNLVSFPSNLSGLKSIKILNLQGCSKLEKLPQNLGEMECLEDLDLGGTAIRQVPSSVAPATILNLKGCKNLVSFPSNLSGLKSLKILNLQGCSKLEKLPQNIVELECLEDLDLGGTAIGQVSSSIARLTNLKTLSFRECKGPPPQSWLLPRRHPNSMCLLLPPLSGLCSLKTLDLSDCGLLEGALPNDIGSLYSLKELNLSNNNFFSLPESIKELSKLKILCLDNCRWLQSLPEVPSNTIFVGAEGCRSLKDVSGALRGGTSKNFALHLFNCHKLLENQDQENSLAVMLLKQYLQQWDNRFSHHFHIPLPGSEIPNWFSCRSDGNLVAIELPPNWLNDEFMGIAMCGVYAPDPEDLNNGIKRMSFAMHIMSNRYLFSFDIPSLTAVKSEHLYLTFVSRVKFDHDNTDLFDVIVHDPSKEFYDPSNDFSDDEIAICRNRCIHAWFGDKSEFRKCGIRLVYKQDLEDVQELQGAEGSTFHQDHNCSLCVPYFLDYFLMPTEVEQHFDTRNYFRAGDRTSNILYTKGSLGGASVLQFDQVWHAINQLSNSRLDPPNFGRPEYSDNDKEPEYSGGDEEPEYSDSVSCWIDFLQFIFRCGNTLFLTKL